MPQSKKYTRRQIIMTGVFGTGTLPLLPHCALAAGRLSPNDPQAIPYGYVENAKQADVKRFPAYKAGQICANCNFIQARYGFYRPCEIFPKKNVNEKGWCSAWIKKA